MVCSPCGREWFNPLYDIEKAKSKGQIEKISVDVAYYAHNRYNSEYEVAKERCEDPWPTP